MVFVWLDVGASCSKLLSNLISINRTDLVVFARLAIISALRASISVSLSR